MPSAYVLDRQPDGRFQIVPAGASARTWSRAELLDFQGSAMLWCPELKPTFVNGVDPRTGVREVDDRGVTPHGIHAGWLWLPWLPFYPRELREVAYRKIVAYRWRHAIIGVAIARDGDPGYHGLRPMNQADVDAWGPTLNTVIDELETFGIIPRMRSAMLIRGIAREERNNSR